VQVTDPTQFGIAVHGVQVSAGPLPSRKNPTWQSEHCELVAAVHVSAPRQWLTEVHSTHDPGFPFSQLPAAHEVHSAAVGPLQVTHDGSHCASAGTVQNAMPQKTRSPSSRFIALTLPLRMDDLSSEKRASNPLARLDRARRHSTLADRNHRPTGAGAAAGRNSSSRRRS
jgi:hypothetical protein